MKFVAISDTHGRHRQIKNLPSGTVLLHGGDVCNRGDADQAQDFLDWFASLDYQFKIFISGNHDFELDSGECVIPDRLSDGSPFPDNMIHLVDQSFELGNIKIWGAATAAKDGLKSEPPQLWSSVPSDTNILMTHYPPHGILDQNWAGKHCGLRGLKQMVSKLAPRVHLFGDIHASYGEKKLGDTQYYNGSLYKARTDTIVNQPFLFEL